MSNASNLEPQAYGVITLQTTFGDLELELFTKQCPKNTRNFVQLCLDGYYNESTFERVEKDFIAIGGQRENLDATQLETDIAPDEFHSRLRFTRRGLLATANTEKNINGPKFFFTLGPAPELQNKHTIFGRLRGNSIYYLADLNECLVDDEFRPISEKKIIQAVVSDNPFQELQPRPHIKEILTNSKRNAEASPSDKGYLEPKFDIKNSKKLSFYEDSDEDEEELEEEVPPNTFKAPLQDSVKTESPPGDTAKESDNPKSKLTEGPNSSEDERQRKLREIRDKIKELKQKLENESATKIRTLSDRRRESLEQGNSSSVSQDSKADYARHLSIEESDSTASRELRLATKKGRQRERETIELMQQFKKKLKETSCSLSKHSKVDQSHQQHGSDDETELALDLMDGDDWLHHKFDAKDTSARLAKDANTKGDDWYSIDDPRNPMVERVDSERAREYKRHRDRDQVYYERDKRHHRDHKSSRHRHR